MQYKEDFLCVIHDKMNHYRTIFFFFQMKNKMVFELGHLLVTLTRMIVHGHGDETFTHHSNELWPNYPNFMIGSLLHLFRNLEKEPIRES